MPLEIGKCRSPPDGRLVCVRAAGIDAGMQSDELTRSQRSVQPAAGYRPTQISTGEHAPRAEQQRLEVHAGHDDGRGAAAAAALGNCGQHLSRRRRQHDRSRSRRSCCGAVVVRDTPSTCAQAAPRSPGDRPAHAGTIVGTDVGRSAALAGSERSGRPGHRRGTPLRRGRMRSAATAASPTASKPDGPPRSPETGRRQPCAPAQPS